MAEDQPDEPPITAEVKNIPETIIGEFSSEMMTTQAQAAAIRDRFQFTTGIYVDPKSPHSYGNMMQRGAAPWKHPAHGAFGWRKDGSFGAADTKVEDIYRAINRALAEGKTVDLTCDGKLISRFHPDGRIVQVDEIDPGGWKL